MTLADWTKRIQDRLPRFILNNKVLVEGEELLMNRVGGSTKRRMQSANSLVREVDFQRIHREFPSTDGCWLRGLCMSFAKLGFADRQLVFVFRRHDLRDPADVVDPLVDE